MRRRTHNFLLALTIGALACGDPSTTVAPLFAPGASQRITNGTPTGSAYSNVGALLIDLGGDGTINGFCSGSLIAETVFLTAGHCVDFPANTLYYVTFAPDITPLPTDLIPVTVIQDPEYNPRTITGDLAVAILPAGATTGITPLELPPLGYLDGLSRQGSLRSAPMFVNVGYGDASPRPGKPTFEFDGTRKMALSPMKALTPNFLGLNTVTSATGEGGACFGDSGGPKFVEGDPTTVVAVTSWGGNICQGTSWATRLDTEEARDFLGEFVTLP